MKTTYDAVNEFKGEWYGSKDNVYICDTGVITGYDQFNDLVSQMETNFGKNHCYAVYKDAYKGICFKKPKSTKELKVMDIDWSKAPEGTTHYGPKNGTYVDGWYKVSDGGTYFSRPHNKVWSKTFADRPISQLIPRPQPTPTYTQAMADNGEFPSVGMMFSTETDGNYKVAMVNRKSVCFVDEDGFLIGIPIGKAKPLTPPIELIDGKAYQYSEEGLYSHGIYCERSKAFSRMNYQVSIDECTNIQPLTVEVK